jgi:hypothetical protein
VDGLCAIAAAAHMGMAQPQFHNLAQQQMFFDPMQQAAMAAAAAAAAGANAAGAFA